MNINYNNGLRAFYFSMAALSWFVSEWVFMGTAALITAVLYSREFRSSSLKALKQAENVGDKIFTDDKELYRQ